LEKVKKNTLAKGLEQEQKALVFLENKGYTLLSQNYRHKKGEIDLIVQKENWIVFVEVRFRASNEFGYPEQTISASKKKLLLQTAEQYTYETGWQGNIRFDVVAILGDTLEHFEDAIT